MHAWNLPIKSFFQTLTRANLLLEQTYSVVAENTHETNKQQNKGGQFEKNFKNKSTDPGFPCSFQLAPRGLVGAAQVHQDRSEGSKDPAVFSAYFA